MAHGTRTLRVAERVRIELSTLLARSVRDPGMAGVTVTEVRMTPDLQLARAYYALAPGGDRRDAAQALRRARPYLRRHVGERLQLRHAPEIRFLYDDSADHQAQVARFFDEIDRQRGEAADGTGDTGAGGAGRDAAAGKPEDADGT